MNDSTNGPSRPDRGHPGHRRATRPTRKPARGFTALKVGLTLAAVAVPAAVGAAVTVKAGTDLAPASAPIRDDRVSGLTGVARSTYDRDVAWTVGGAGNGPYVLAVDPDGDTAGYLNVNGAQNGDWRDIAPGPGHTLWIADSSRDGGLVTVHRIWEPSELSRTAVPARSFSLQLPDGSREVEALLVNPRSGRLLVATSETGSGDLYTAPRRLDPASPNPLTRIASTPAGVTGGSFAPGSSRMVLVNNDNAYLYERPGAPASVQPLPDGTTPTGVSVDRTGETLLLSTARPGDAILTQPVRPGGWPSAPTTPPSSPSPTAAPSTGAPTPTPTPTATPTTAPPPPDPSGNPSTPGAMKIGVYSGSFSYEAYRDDFGAYPDVETIYLNADQVETPNLDRHRAQIDRGISPIITLGYKNGPFTRAEIAAWGTEVRQYFTTFVNGLRELSQYAARAQNGTRVYFADEHEAQVKINQDKYAYSGYGASQKPTTAQSAAAWNKVMDYVRTAAPDVLRTYWYGGSGANEDTFASLLEPSLIQVASFDPYRWRHNSASDTPQELWGKKVSTLKAQPWMRNPDGSLKPWGLTEWGTDASLGDRSNALFVVEALRFLRREGASFAVYFNRVDGNDTANDFVITDGSQPLTLAAFLDALVGEILG